MKQDLIKDVVQGMLPYLNNAQSEKLQEVLSYALAKYEVTENQNRENNSEQNYIELFLAAKRIEGCSEKSLKYYKATIEMMSATVGKSVKHIETDDIRRYLTEYQEKKKSSKVWPYPTLTAEELAPYQAEEKTVQKYSLETYDVNAFTRMLFESLDKRIMNLSPAVKKEYKKLYVAYKLDTNFVDIVFQKQRLRISINMKFSEINDPNDICKDITGLGRWGNGDVELFMEHQDELDQIMEIVKQSYDTQAE